MKASRLIIAFRIEDEKGNDITPNVSNSIITSLGEDVNIDDYEATGIRLALRGFLFSVTRLSSVRHLFPLNPRKVPKTLCGNDPDKYRWLVSKIQETRIRIEHLDKND